MAIKKIEKQIGDFWYFFVNSTKNGKNGKKKNTKVSKP
jgi:hypothetical protein